MRIIIPFLFATAIMCLLLAGCKDTATTPIDYDAITTIKYSEHVQPLLNATCATGGCHTSQHRAAGLSLSSWEELFSGSHYGEVVVPFTSSKSLLITLFDGTPLRKPHPSLGNAGWSSEAITFLKRWIDEGARNDAGMVAFHGSMRRLYVPNQGEDNVAIIDLDSLVVARYVNVGRLPIVDGPHFVEANAHYWYVSLINTAEVWKFDAHTDTLVGTVNVHGQPALLALTPDGSKLYVSQFMSSTINTVTVINTNTMTVVKTLNVGKMPHGLRVNHEGTRLYCANMLSDDITVIDVATDEILETIPLADDVHPFGPAKYQPIEIAISPDDSLVLVSCSETKEVRILNANSNQIVDSIHVGDQPWHLQFTPDGQYCYVTNRREHSVSMIHLPMRHVMETIPAGTPATLNYPHGCDISVDGRYTFVSSENVGHGYTPRYSIDYPGNVVVIDNFTKEIVKVLEVGKMPTGISIARE